MISTVLPTALTVSDLKRSLEFYCGLLGFRVAAELPPPAERERWDRYHEQVCRIQGAQIAVVYLEAQDGQTHLELIEYTQPPTPVPARPGPQRARLGDRRARRLGRGRRDGAPRARPGSRCFRSVPYTTDDGVSTTTTYLYDPDGNALCSSRPRELTVDSTSSSSAADTTASRAGRTSRGRGRERSLSSGVRSSAAAERARR